MSRGPTLVQGVFLSVVSVLALAGCGGSEAGNPSLISTTEQTAGKPNSADLPVGGYSTQIENAVCARLTACFPSLRSTECKSGLDATVGFGPTLGLAGNDSTLSSLTSAELAGTIHGNAAAARRCLADLSSLACSSQSIQSTFDPSVPSDFTKVPGMIPASGTSCQGVF